MKGEGMHTATAKLTQVRADIESQLAKYYRTRLAKAAALHEDYAALWQSMATLGSNAGKRLRPYVTLITYEGLSGNDYHDVLPVATALEVLHASVLMHDDIIDRDYVRYNRPNIAGQYRERYAAEKVSASDRDHYANAAALLAGDLALSGAYELIAESKLPDTTKLRAMRVLGDAIFAVAGGELLDTESVLMPFESVDALTIARLKTASYSFITPLRMAAALAGLPESEQQPLIALGTAIGISFQLTDDVLGLFGDEAVTGKPTTSDLEEGKRTYLMQQALARSKAPARERLLHIMSKGTVTTAELEEARGLVRASGAYAETQRLIAEYTAEAQQALSQLPLNDAAMQELQHLITWLAQRQA